MLSDSSESGENNEDSNTEDENENIINAPRKRMRMWILSSSDEESESVSQKTEIAADGIAWSKVKEGGTAGRSPTQNIFRDVAGLFFKRNIMLDNVFSAFVLIIHYVS